MFFCLFVNSLCLTYAHGNKDLVHSFFLAIKEDCPPKADQQVRVLLQEAALVHHGEVSEAAEMVCYPCDSLHCEAIAADCR